MCWQLCRRKPRRSRVCRPGNSHTLHRGRRTAASPRGLRRRETSCGWDLQSCTSRRPIHHTPFRTLRCPWQAPWGGASVPGRRCSPVDGLQWWIPGLWLTPPRSWWRWRQRCGWDHCQLAAFHCLLHAARYTRPQGAWATHSGAPSDRATHRFFSRRHRRLLHRRASTIPGRLLRALGRPW